MMEGGDGHAGRGDGLWNIVDVRNIAAAQRRMADLALDVKVILTPPFIFH
jgi:hypothetical protein